MSVNVVVKLDDKVYPQDLIEVLTKEYPNNKFSSEWIESRKISGRINCSGYMQNDVEGYAGQPVDFYYHQGDEDYPTGLILDISDSSKLMAQRILPYFGGTYKENDCDGTEPIYIPKTKGSVEDMTDERKLRNLVYANVGVSVGDVVMKFFEETDKEVLIKLLKGM